MDDNVFVIPEIEKLLKQYSVGELYTDRQGSQSKISAENRRLQRERFGALALPLYITLTPDGKTETGRYIGSTQFSGYAEFLKFMKNGLKPANGKVSQEP